MVKMNRAVQNNIRHGENVLKRLINVSNEQRDIKGQRKMTYLMPVRTLLVLQHQSLWNT